MALLRSNRLVHLDRNGQVIAEKMIDAVVEAKRAVEAEACYAQLAAWQSKASYHAPTRMTVPGRAVAQEVKGFGYAIDGSRGYSKRFKRWGTK